MCVHMVGNMVYKIKEWVMQKYCGGVPNTLKFDPCIFSK